MTKNKIRIAIAGIGGIGGYIGGKLARFYSNNQQVEIIFICRGEHHQAINTNGLELLSKNEILKCYPHLVSSNPKEIGTINVFIICTKNYSVAAMLKQYADCITPKTIVITTQNTVNGSETISPLLPNGATLLEGSIYISSNIISPGKVHHVNGPSKLFFGSAVANNTIGTHCAKLLNDAGIETTFSNNIHTILWKKFMFVSPAAIVTALYQITFSEILQVQESCALFINLISDLMQLAKVKNIEVDETTVENNCKLLGNFSAAVKSSFQLDLEKGKPTEIDSLVNYVAKESKVYSLPATYYNQALKQLMASHPNLC